MSTKQDNRDKQEKMPQDNAAVNESEFREAEVMDNVPEADDELSENEQEEQEAINEIDKLAKELAETKVKLEKEKKEYLFLMAEFDNFRKRTLKEKSEIIRNAAESVMKGLLPIVDDFERGIAAITPATDSDAAREGMELIYNKLVKYMEQNGVKPIESNGADFDADLHEAIAMVPMADPSKKGKVIDTMTKGYMINDKVLRHAKVAVGQ